MRNLHPFERQARGAAFLLSCLLYVMGGLLFHLWTKTLPAVASPSFSVNSVHLSFTQIELQAAEETPPVTPPPKPEPEPEPPEEVDVVLEEIVKEPEPAPEPEPELVQVEAQVTQEASSMEPYVESDHVGDWVDGLIQKEKYYPASAQRAGQEGVFELSIKVGADGVISEATVISGKGSRLLRRALEKIIHSLPGQYFGRPLEEAIEISMEFEFELN